MTDAGNGNGAVGKRSDGGKSNRLVGAGGHVHGESVQPAGSMGSMGNRAGSMGSRGSSFGACISRLYTGRLCTGSRSGYADAFICPGNPAARFSRMFKNSVSPCRECSGTPSTMTLQPDRAARA